MREPIMDIFYLVMVYLEKPEINKNIFNLKNLIIEFEALTDQF